MDKSTEDCYYFLYSVCKKGESCTYRHNPTSRQNTILCESWERSRKCRDDCPYRHSYYHFQKKRADDYCFWEDKETGCTKEFCEFRHRNPEKDAWKENEAKGFKFSTDHSSEHKRDEIADFETVNDADFSKRAAFDSAKESPARLTQNNSEAKNTIELSWSKKMNNLYAKPPITENSEIIPNNHKIIPSDNLDVFVNDFSDSIQHQHNRNSQNSKFNNKNSKRQNEQKISGRNTEKIPHQESPNFIGEPHAKRSKRKEILELEREMEEIDRLLKDY